MNKSFYNQENIDAYLTNRLSGEDKKLFESGLEKDPLIQNEINLQKEIIESLKHSRKLELKNRLNQIEVGSAVGSSFRLQIAASVLIILGFLSGGTYFFLNKTDQHTTEVSSGIAMPEPQLPKPLAPVAQQPQQIILPETNKATPEKKTVPERKTPVFSESNTQNIAEVKSPDLKTAFEDEEIKTESNVTVPEGNVISNEESYKSDVELSIQPVGEKDFHYQYYSNKLYLYCDFKSKPYELLEWNTKKSKQLYLYFNNTFYELKSNQTEITPLKAIHDKQLIKQLNSIKDK